MQDLNGKITGNTLTATEWNQVPSELQNIIEDTGQSLSSGDLNQTGKGVAQYAANGDFYTDSGAADAYVLTEVGGKQFSPTYVDGMRVRFVPDNSNTGASTVDVAGLGVKNIKTRAGADPAAGDIKAAEIIELYYDVIAGYFIAQTVLFATNAEAQAKTATARALTPANLAALDATDTFSGLAERATAAEVLALADTSRFVTPGRIPIASETQQGLAERATAAEVLALADTSRFVVPATLPIASETQQGLAEAATQAEVDAGTDTERFVTPATLSSAPPPAGSVNRASLNTAIVTLSGTVVTNSDVNITLDAYSFFPMIHVENTGETINGVSTLTTFLCGHDVDGASADAPRFRLVNTDTASHTYDIDYRYIQA